MADTSNLSKFLSDVADAIRTKKETIDAIPAKDFDTEILSIETGIDTSDATAAADNIENGYTAYVNGKKISGTITTSLDTIITAGSDATITDTGEALNVDRGYGEKIVLKSEQQLRSTIPYATIASIGGVTSDKIMKGETVFGVKGSAESSSGPITQEEYDKAVDTTSVILYGSEVLKDYVQYGLVVNIDFNDSFADKTNNVTVTNSGIVLEYDNDLNRTVAKTSSATSRLSLSTPFINLSSFTLSIRAKSDGTNTGEHNMLLGVYGTSRNTSFAIKSHFGKYSIERYLNSIDSTYDVNADNDWHRYTVTLDNGTTVKMYVDDNLVLEQKGTYNVSNGTWLIGNYVSGFNMPWNGQYYEVLIYNRVLTEDEIRHNVLIDNGGDTNV